MRVGVYFTKRSPVLGGGYTYEAGIYNALKELASESDHTFVVFTPKVKGHNPAPKRDSLELQYIPRTTLFLNRLLRIVRRVVYVLIPQSHHRFQLNLIDRFLRSQDIHLVWFPTPVAYEIDLPYIFTLWDLQHRLQPYFPEVKDGYIWKNRESYYSLMLRRASAIVVGTETGKKEVEFFYQVPGDRIKVLPLPTPQFSNEKKAIDEIDIYKKRNIPENYLFYPAQFWPHKNHVNLLISLKILKDNYQLVLPMVFVGSDQGNEKYVRRLVNELELSSQVYFLGFVSQEELTALYCNAFALTNLTFFGPDNLPPLEAFALGTPVIASDVSGASEQLEDAALLVDPGNPEHIAKAIYTLYNKPELRESMIEKGLVRARKWNSYDFVRSIFSVINDLELIRRCWE